MNNKKMNLAILLGGKSGEHEVSLLSAKSVISAVDREKYNLIVIGIKKDGSWRLMDSKDYLINADDPSRISLKESKEEVWVSLQASSMPFQTGKGPLNIDVIFPVLHGTYGEDGTLQGMLDMLSIPYVGSDYLGSGAAMDKDIAKRLFKEAGLPISPYLVFYREDHSDINHVVEVTEKELKYPLFIKPANLGSSVGINKANDRESLKPALEEAWLYDRKIVVEEGIEGREVECALLGNHHVDASTLGEIIPKHEFYSYEAKYIDPEGAELIVGTEMNPEIKNEIQEVAKKAFRALGCEGLARADFFVEEDSNRVYINEINTIPGFTKISMYPKLWEKSGVGYAELIDRLIQLAMTRQEIKNSLKTDYS